MEVDTRQFVMENNLSILTRLMTVLDRFAYAA